MNQKIQSLIDGGFITISDVIEWANQYKEEEEAKIAMEFMYDSDYYEGDDWQSNDPDAPDYYDTQDVEWPIKERSSNPEYIIASTAYYMEETYVFEADEHGVITNFGEYGGIALRFGDKDWTNKALAVERTFGEGKYEFVREIDRVSKADHHLFKRIDNDVREEDDNVQLPSDTWDGGVVQEP